MRRCDREHQLDLAQRAALVAGRHAGSAGQAGERAEREIDPAGQERLPRPRQHFGHQSNARAGLLRIELGDQVEDGVDAEDRVHGDAQLDLPTVPDATYAALQVVRGLQQVTTFVEQFAAGRRQPGLVAPSIEQQDVEVALQLADRVGQRRRHAAELVGGAREAAVAIDRIEHSDRIEVQHIQIV